MAFSTKFVLCAFIAQFMIANALPHGRTVVPVRYEKPTPTVPGTATLQARGGTQCQPLTPADVSNMPSWGKIQDYAKQQFGDGSYRLVTNPTATDVANSPAALFCAPSGPVPLHVDTKTQSCSESNNAMDGSSTGTSTTVTMKQKVGVKASTSMTISQFSSYTSSFSFGVDFGIPDTGLGISSTTSFSSTVSNNQTQSVESSFDNMQEVSLAYTNAKGKKCMATIHTKSCQASASAQIPLVATGVLWFEYDDRRAQKVGGDGSKHYKWAVSLEDALKNPADRTSTLSLNGKFQAVSNTKTQYDVNCK